MASGKQSPRQKMINMMYLVLTALLAMNVSKDILNSFITIDDGQRKSMKAINTGVSGQMSLFKQRAEEKPAKYGADYKRAEAMHKTAQDLFTHINLIKAKTISISEGKTMEEVYNASQDTVLNLIYVDGKDKYDDNTRVMIGTGVAADPEMDTSNENTEKYNYRVADLKLRLEAFRNQIATDFPKEKDLVASVNNIFKFDDLKDVEGKVVTWEMLNFYHVPLAATTSILSKIQSDILNVESDVIGSIFASVEGQTYKFSKLTEAVIPEATYISQGGKFKADVFLAAFDDTNPPTILLGAPGVKYDSISQKLNGESVQLEMDGPKGVVEIPANGLGPQHREGVIIFEPTGMKKVVRGFNLDYTVAAPALVVSPTKMNVFYRGLSNPVSISVAGYKDSDLSPSMTNGKLTKGANGWAVSGLGSGKTAVISCSARQPDGSSRNVGSVDFRVKNVPDPIAYFGGKSSASSSIGKGELRAAAGVIAKLKDFEFDGVKFTVTQFKFSMVIKGQPIEKVSKSNRLTAEMKQMIQSAKSGQKVYIENIKAKGPGGGTRSLGSITLKIK